MPPALTQNPEQIKNSSASSAPLEKKQQAIDFKLLQAEMARIGVDKNQFLQTIKNIKNHAGSTEEKALVLMEGLLMGLGEKVFDPEVTKQAIQEMVMVLNDSNFITSEITRAFTEQAKAAYAAEYEGEQQKFDVQLEAVKNSLNDLGFNGSLLPDFLEQYHTGVSVQVLAAELAEMLPNEAQSGNNSELYLQKTKELCQELALSGMVDQTTLREVLTLSFSAVDEVEGAKTTRTPSDLVNYSELGLREQMALNTKYREGYQQLINQLSKKHDIVKLMGSIKVLQDVLQDVGGDGQKFLAALEASQGFGTGETQDLIRGVLATPDMVEFFTYVDDGEELDAFLGSEAAL